MILQYTKDILSLKNMCKNLESDWMKKRKKHANTLIQYYLHNYTSPVTCLGNKSSSVYTDQLK